MILFITTAVETSNPTYCTALLYPPYARIGNAEEFVPTLTITAATGHE
jgi:hypothetical protein